MADGGPRITILSLGGRRHPVPPRLQTLGRGWLPWALSPDARLVAHATRGGDVLVSGVRDGGTRTVLRSPCPDGCLGDPTFAWSPDSRSLAVAAGGIGRDGNRRPSVLEIVAPDGRVLRTLELPRLVDDWGGPLATEVRAWSPDGARLLLGRVGTYGTVAAAVRDLATGASRTVSRFAGCDGPRLTWSPDGRHLALVSRGTQDCVDRFELIDAVRGKTLVNSRWNKGRGKGGTVWAADGKSVFGSWTVGGSPASSRIDRIFLSGRREALVEAGVAWLVPVVALPTGLVYGADAAAERRQTLYLHRFATDRGQRLGSVPRSGSVAPLQRLP